MAKTSIEKFFSNKFVQLAALAAAGLGLWRSWSNKGTDGVGAIRPGEEDKDAVREILLYFENDSDLYRRHEQPIREMLLKKLRKGMQLDLDYLAKSSMIDAVVRDTLNSYFRSFGRFYVSTATRNAMNYEIAQSILLGAQDDYEYENNNK